MRHRVWLAVLVVVLALAGAVGFLARQGLDRADRWASVAAFLLALTVAGGTVAASMARRRPTVASGVARGGRSIRCWRGGTAPSSRAARETPTRSST
ncbi:hypothetical protein [Micromonospora sp. RP3T]|uniref:hypothetical protein n=1 Tax=Micromonospora sp. RP3T TaxID=2135446 RepID=UPI0011B28A3D|nr:hypothetical protein [Micromonospora sp. RP3T]